MKPCLLNFTYQLGKKGRLTENLEMIMTMTLLFSVHWKNTPTERFEALWHYS